MEILPCEEVECAAGVKMKLQRAADPGIQHSGYDNMISTHYTTSEESSDEDDSNIPVKSEDCVCCVCGEDFPFLDKLMEHFKTHKNEVCCHLCQTKFSRTVSLALHLKYAHPKYNLFCAVCQVPFRGTWHLNEHLEKHKQEVLDEEEVEVANVDPLIKTKETGDINNESIISNGWDRHGFLRDHSYCLPVHLTPCKKAVQTRSDTKTTNQLSCFPNIKTETKCLDSCAQQRKTSFCTVSSSIQTGDENGSSIMTSQDVKNGFIKKEQGSSCSSSLSIQPEPPCKEEYEIQAENECTDTTEEDSYSLPSGDKEYSPDEDWSSDSQCSTSSNTDDSCSSHRKTKRRKKMESERKTPFAYHSMHAGIFTCAGKFGVQTDTPRSKFVNMVNVDDCEKMPTVVCCMCKVVCENKDLLLKHIAEKHPTAVYICAFCLNAFPQQDVFKKHNCRNRPTGKMNVLLVNTVTQLPAVSSSDGDSQRIRSAAILDTKPNNIKMIPISELPPSQTPAIASSKSTISQSSQEMTELVPTVTSAVKNSQTVGQTETAQTNPMGSVSPLGPDLHPQAVTVPQTLVRPHYSPGALVAHPNVLLSSPSMVRPSLPNQSRMTLRIPTPLNPSLHTQNKVIVSFSPTVNVSGPVLVSVNNNKFMPAPRQTTAANVRPLQLPGNVRHLLLSANVRPHQVSGSVRPPQVSGNVRPLQVAGILRPLQVSGIARPLQVSGNVVPPEVPGNVTTLQLPGNAPMTSVSCPTLLSDLLQKNQPQVSPHTSAQVQVPTPGPLKIVAMFENKSKELALQKRLAQTWRSKSIFSCRHCGAISRQPSLQVRHRYLHQGSRLYRCQCGRSFQQRLHLLRHQVQHAQSVRFVCAHCGNTFEGAHKLTRHKQGLQQKHGSVNSRQYAKTKCRADFNCTCGQVFARPSALLWHMLKNTKVLKHLPEKKTKKKTVE